MLKDPGGVGEHEMLKKRLRDRVGSSLEKEDREQRSKTKKTGKKRKRGKVG